MPAVLLTVEGTVDHYGNRRKMSFRRRLQQFADCRCANSKGECFLF